MATYLSGCVGQLSKTGSLALRRQATCLARCSQPAIRRSVSSLSRRGFRQAARTTVQPFTESLPFPASRSYSVPANSVVPDFAFAFDIDGVLLHSSTPLPGATECLRYLQEKNIPFILLTNGGGKHEEERVAELSSKLKVPLSVDNFIQSHTPFQEFVDGSNGKPALKDKCILVTGGDGDKCRKVAERYGFNNVVTPADIFTAYPDIWPFSDAFSGYHSSSARPLPRPICPDNPSESLKIDAMFVYNDPRDWALDTQLILDLLISREGILGTYSKKNGDPSLPNNGWLQDGQPPLYCSNPDLFWATGYHLSRLGQGGFQAALRGVWDATTDGKAKLDMTVIGKPCYETYAYAEKVLDTYRKSLLGPRAASQDGSLRRVFMVGDNPASDIQGANNFKSPLGVNWSSILVKTGVYRTGTKPAHEPTVLVDNVLEAVRWGVKEQGWDSTSL